MTTPRSLLAVAVVGSTLCFAGCASRNSEFRQPSYSSADYVLVESGLGSRIPRRVLRGYESTAPRDGHPTATASGDGVRNMIGEPIVSGSVNVFTR